MESAVPLRGASFFPSSRRPAGSDTHLSLHPPLHHPVSFFCSGVAHEIKTTTTCSLQEGTIALHAAVDKYDPTRGVRFFTYADWALKAAFEQAVSETRIDECCLR